MRRLRRRHGGDTGILAREGASVPRNTSTRLRPSSCLNPSTSTRSTGRVRRATPAGWQALRMRRSRPAAVGSNDDLGCAGAAVPVTVLARLVQFDVVMMRVLDGRHSEAASLGRGYQAFDECGLAAARTPDNGDHAHQANPAPSNLPTPQAASPAPPPITTRRKPPRRPLWPVNRLRITRCRTAHTVTAAAT